MPYEATVPVHRRLLWPAVADPERLLAALPNAVIDASGGQGVAGRLKLRVRDQSVTFRGIARVVETVPAGLRISVEVEAAFGRANGSVDGVVRIALRQAGSGTRVVVSGDLSLAGAPLGFPEPVLDAALQRLVRRWFTALAASSPVNRPEAAQAAAADSERPAERAAGLVVVRDLPGGAPADGGSGDAGTETSADADIPSEPQAAPALLRLIQPDPLPGPDLPDGPPDAGASASDDADDIWAAARRRGLPRWYAVVVGGFTTAVGAAVLLAAALRRRHRR